MRKALVAGALVLRLLLIWLGAPGKLSRSIEIATPVTSIYRLAEGYWRKRIGLSPYAGNAYHGSPLLLETLGPVADKSPLIFSLADLASAALLFMISKRLRRADECTTMELAGLVYLWNPFSILACIGGSISSLENLFILLAMYAAAAGRISLAAFGWVAASHIGMYPLLLFIPVALALNRTDLPKHIQRGMPLSWWRVTCFILWSVAWSLCLLGLCSISLNRTSSLREMFFATYGFILSVNDLTPNMGLYWYFFTEVFAFFRPFFLMVFHGNILCMILPLCVRFYHRPLFLAFVLMAVVSALKSYPAVGDSALCLGMMALFVPELSGFKYTFLLVNGYICIAMLGPAMYNLWIWRGTGNANFYYATTLLYAILQATLIVESVASMLRHDRSLKKAAALSQGNADVSASVMTHSTCNSTSRMAGVE